MAQSMEHPHGRGRVLGFPLEGFGLFTSLLLSFAAAFFTFFATTCLSIFALLAWNLIGGTSGTPLSCAQVTGGVDGVELISTNVANSTSSFDDVFTCVDGVGTTSALPAEA